MSICNGAFCFLSGRRVTYHHIGIFTIQFQINLVGCITFVHAHTGRRVLLERDITCKGGAAPAATFVATL